VFRRYRLYSPSLFSLAVVNMHFALVCEVERHLVILILLPVFSTLNSIPFKTTFRPSLPLEKAWLLVFFGH
jgi:hypothetical protein